MIFAFEDAADTSESALLVLESQYGKALDEKGYSKLQLIVNELSKLPENELEHLNLETSKFETGVYIKSDLTEFKRFLNLIEDY